MSDSQGSEHEPGVHVLDSKLYFIFPFADQRALAPLREMRERMMALSVADLNETIQLPLSEKQLRKAGSDEFRIWEPAEFKIDRFYFHEFVQKIFGNDQVRDSAPTYFDSASLAPLRLTSHARNLLSGGFGNAATGLCVNLRAAAAQRLARAGCKAPAIDINGKAEHYLRFQIASGHCLFFGSGVGMLLIEIEPLAEHRQEQAIPFDQLLELNNQLCRGNYWSSALDKLRCWRFSEAGVERQASSDKGATEIGPPSEITTFRGLGPICISLLGEIPEEDIEPTQIRTVHWEKVPIFCGVKTSCFSQASSRELACIRLARKETADYAPCHDTVADALYSPFTYLMHAASIEGGVLLVEVDEDSSAPDYVKNFVTNATQRAYLPLMLWALHEFVFLTELSKSATGWIDFVRPNEGHRVLLHDFRARLYNYRFHFRFAHASSISMHNDMFRLWRDTYDLGKILDEIDKDVVEAENMLEYMDSKERQERAQRDRNLLGIFAALAGTAIAMPEWRDMTFAKLFFTDCTDRADWICTFPLHYVLVALLLLSAFGLAYVWGKSLIKTWKNRKLKDEAIAKLGSRRFY
jgi:hypothetical protein